MLRASLAGECCPGAASDEGTARNGLCAKAGICDIVFSGHRLEADDQVSVSNGHGGRSSGRTANRQRPGGASRLQLAVNASSLCSEERPAACVLRVANRRDAAWIARNVDPDSVSVMKAPWLDHRSRLARRSVTLGCPVPAWPCPAAARINSIAARTLHSSLSKTSPVSSPAHRPRAQGPAESRHGVPASHLDDEPVRSDELVAAREVRAPLEDTQPPRPRKHRIAISSSFCRRCVGTVSERARRDASSA